jgi:hypothetical protein
MRLLAAENPMLLLSAVMYLGNTTIAAKAKTAIAVRGVNGRKQRVLQTVQRSRKLRSDNVHCAFDD